MYTAHINAPAEPVGLKKDRPWIFLGGPCQGAPDWQLEFVNSWRGPEEVYFLDPRRRNGVRGDDEYLKQVDWETRYLGCSDLRVFWFPRPAEDPGPGRCYGQTTRTEIGEWLGHGSIEAMTLVGIEPGVPGERYLRTRLEAAGIPVYDSFQDLLRTTEDRIRGYHEDPVISFWTSDTHFGSARTLEFSRRPFRGVTEMDDYLIRVWNRTVRPRDIVYHLGDFGDPGALRFLNGRIRLIPGNYEERDGTRGLKDAGVEVLGKTEVIRVGSRRIGMCHYPSIAKGLDADFALFGHTHGRQTIKNWPGLDVGTDAHHFRPISEAQLLGWYTSIQGHYDEENFV